MRVYKYIFFVGVLMVVLAACGTAATQTDAPDLTETMVLATDAPVVTTTAEPVVDECLSCHTDKEKLVSLAAPVVAAESESSGVG